jgi:hypothetical protein
LAQISAQVTVSTCLRLLRSPGRPVIACLRLLPDALPAI